MSKGQLLKNFRKVLKIKFILTIILNNKDNMQKIEEQLGESVVSNTDPASALTGKIKNHLPTLRKPQKFETRTYFQLYPSDPIPPRLYGVIKAHKPEKILSHVSYSFNNWHSTR